MKYRTLVCLQLGLLLIGKLLAPGAPSGGGGDSGGGSPSGGGNQKADSDGDVNNAHMSSTITPPPNNLDDIETMNHISIYALKNQPFNLFGMAGTVKSGGQDTTAKYDFTWTIQQQSDPDHPPYFQVMLHNGDSSKAKIQLVRTADWKSIQKLHVGVAMEVAPKTGSGAPTVTETKKVYNMIQNIIQGYYPDVLQMVDGYKSPSLPNGSVTDLTIFRVKSACSDEQDFDSDDKCNLVLTVVPTSYSIPGFTYKVETIKHREKRTFTVKASYSGLYYKNADSVNFTLKVTNTKGPSGQIKWEQTATDILQVVENKPPQDINIVNAISKYGNKIKVPNGPWSATNSVMFAKLSCVDPDKGDTCTFSIKTTNINNCLEIRNTHQQWVKCPINRKENDDSFIITMQTTDTAQNTIEKVLTIDKEECQNPTALQRHYVSGTHHQYLVNSNDNNTKYEQGSIRCEGQTNNSERFDYRDECEKDSDLKQGDSVEKYNTLGCFRNPDTPSMRNRTELTFTLATETDTHGNYTYKISYTGAASYRLNKTIQLPFKVYNYCDMNNSSSRLRNLEKGPGGPGGPGGGGGQRLHHNSNLNNSQLNPLKGAELRFPVQVITTPEKIILYNENTKELNPAITAILSANTSIYKPFTTQTNGTLKSVNQQVGQLSRIPYDANDTLRCMLAEKNTPGVKDIMNYDDNNDFECAAITGQNALVNFKSKESSYYSEKKKKYAAIICQTSQLYVFLLQAEIGVTYNRPPGSAKIYAQQKIPHGVKTYGVGAFTVVDPDIRDTHVITLDPKEFDNKMFIVTPGTNIVKFTSEEKSDFTKKSTYKIKAHVVDPARFSIDYETWFTVSNPNVVTNAAQADANRKASQYKHPKPMTLDAQMMYTGAAMAVTTGGMAIGMFIMNHFIGLQFG